MRYRDCTKKIYRSSYLNKRNAASISTLDADMSDVLKRESNFGYKNVFMDSYSKIFIVNVACVSILKFCNIQTSAYSNNTDFFLAWNLKITLLDSGQVLCCCHFILCVTRKLNITLGTTFKRFYNSQII